MATNITTELQGYYFSSQLPDILWQTDSEALTVSLYCPDEGVTIIEVTLTPTDSVVRLWEVREAVERQMRHLSLSHISMVIRWREKGHQYFSESSAIQVYYSSLNIEEDCIDWLTANFLTTSNSKPMPASGATESLFFVNHESSSIVPDLLASCRLASGEVCVIALDGYFEEYPVDETAVQQISWNAADVLAAAVEAEETVVEVIGVAVRAGVRLMTYYKPLIPADQAFVFANAFGVIETAWLNCVTTTKTKDGRKVAHVARRARIYDLDQEVTHEVETCPLPLEVARWLAQLVTSPRAWLGNGRAIIITDGDASISDDAAVMNSVKFTWQYDDGRAVMDAAGADINIFQKPPFSHQFD